MEELKTNRKIFGFELDRVGKFFIIFCVVSSLFLIIYLTVYLPILQSQFDDKIKDLSCIELVELKKEITEFDTSFRFKKVNNELVSDGCEQ